MAKIEWAQLCETAFLDNCGRLCLIGITTHWPVPSLPVSLHQLMIAVRVSDLADEPAEVRISVITPSQRVVAPSEPDVFHVDVAGEYVLITLRELPLAEEGLYRFSVAIDEQEPVTVQSPVVLARRYQTAGVH